MSTAELPDFQSAPAWMGASGEVVLGVTLVTAVNCRHLMVIDWPALDAPWVPLDTAEAWASRTDRDALAGVIQSVLDRWFDGYSGGHGEIADAVLAALPELMGGGER